MDFHVATGCRHFYFSQLLQYIKNTASHIAWTFTSASLKAHRFIPYTYHAWQHTPVCLSTLSSKYDALQHWLGHINFRDDKSNINLSSQTSEGSTDVTLPQFIIKIKMLECCTSVSDNTWSSIDCLLQYSMHWLVHQQMSHLWFRPSHPVLVTCITNVGEGLVKQTLTWMTPGPEALTSCTCQGQGLDIGWSVEEWHISRQTTALRIGTNIHRVTKWLTPGSLGYHTAPNFWGA